MKLTFFIDYRTHWGESLYVSADITALGDGDASKALKMDIRGDRSWWAELELPDDTPSFRYEYVVRNENGDTKREWGDSHLFEPVAGVSRYNLYDRWHEQPFNKPFYSRAFTECIFRHDTALDTHVLPGTNLLVFHVAAPTVPSDCILAISGDADSLGNWKPESALRLSAESFPVWKIVIPASGLTAATQYKFLIVRRSDGSVVGWEEGGNRRLGITPEAGCATVIAGLRYHCEETPWKGAGTAIPVFSLRTEADFGVGDFFDLMPMVDWAAATGQTFLQILPINDTTMTGTWTDSYPYNANSIFALHPMYLRLEELGTLNDPARVKYYNNLRQELNALPTVDYERVNKAKNEYFREIFTQEGAKLLASDDFKTFKDKNAGWLEPYAAFCVLRDRFATPDFSKWGKYAAYSPEILRKVKKEAEAEMDFVYYLQFNLDRQMRRVHEYANSHGIALKGDIPIGISRTSADAWTDTRLFNMDCQAGAPPDDFSVLGQNWGFPTYNWDEMAKDGYAWWKARFRKMAEYFDAYRIDHVLGFFRIWQIPMDALHGLLGYFNPALPFTQSELRYNYDFWIDPDLHTTPYIMDYFVEDFFGPYTSEALNKFCKKLKGGRYRLKNEFNTQRKVADYFAGQPGSEKNTRICQGLLGLIDQVLFIEDPVEKGKYHPRITSQYTYIYRALNDYERWCFNRLYNDFFYHRHNEFWYDKAMSKLPPLIDSTDMLVCAEDLGMIPDCVPAVMNKLDILSLEIQRMPKEPGAAFGDTWHYPYYSVCTTSTHDMGGIRQWWEEDRARSQRYFNEVLKEQGPMPYYAEPWICDRIIDLNLAAPSMLCIFPLQDWLSISGKLRREKPTEEQINVPADSRHYWRYRMHLTIGELAANTDFTTGLRKKIESFGR